MNALREKVRCPRVLGLVRRYLTAGVVLPDGTREATPQGVPQGGPLSPLNCWLRTGSVPPAGHGHRRGAFCLARVWFRIVQIHTK